MKRLERRFEIVAGELTGYGTLLLTIKSQGSSAGVPDSMKGIGNHVTVSIKEPCACEVKED